MLSMRTPPEETKDLVAVYDLASRKLNFDDEQEMVDRQSETNKRIESGKE